MCVYLAIVAYSYIIVNKEIRVPSRADAGTSGTAYISEQLLSVLFIN